MNPFRKSQAQQEAAAAYLRTSRLLLQAIGLHSVEGEPQEHQLFRATLNDLQAKLSEKVPPSEGLVAVGVASKAMEDYSRHTSRFIKAQNFERQSVIQMLAETVIRLAPESGHAAAELREIDAKLGKATTVEEIRALKSRMAECLKSIQHAPAEKPEENSPQITAKSEMNDELEGATGETPWENVPQNDDPLTGLPIRQRGEMAVRQCSQTGKRWYAVVFVVDRIRVINARFGYAIGDRILFLFVQRLAQELLASDQLFRWAGASFMAVLERSGSEEEVGRQMERIFSRRQEETFTVGPRSVVLPISASWSVIPISDSELDAVVRKIDWFAAQGER